MDLHLFTSILPEIDAAIRGRRFGRVFQLSKFEFAIDLRIADSRYLFISIEPADPRIYLIERRLRDVERSAGNPSPFALQLKKYLSNFVADGVEQTASERVATFEFSGADELGEPRTRSLVVQLTGRSSNLFITDERGAILERARETIGEGQQTGDVYSPPIRPGQKHDLAETEIRPVAGETLSAMLDRDYSELAERRRFTDLANASRQRLDREIAKREKLLRNLTADIADHGDAEKWKRFGDLLLANTGTARRTKDGFEVTDYFDDAVPTIEIPADESDSVTEAAEKYFRRYTKARNAGDEIERRIAAVEKEISAYSEERARLEEAIAERDESFFAAPAPDERRSRRNKPKTADSNGYARKFISSDGFEILVGKKAKDNDHLTFRIARSLDTWMHAADYPGSHVVIRNQNKKEIPPRTLLEAAQLAAFYSQGKKQPKAAVHYTLKKFVNKPKGSAPGLVSLSSFKTLLVEPAVPAIVRA